MALEKLKNLFYLFKQYRKKRKIEKTCKYLDFLNEQVEGSSDLLKSSSFIGEEELSIYPGVSDHLK